MLVYLIIKKYSYASYCSLQNFNFSLMLWHTQTKLLHRLTLHLLGFQFCFDIVFSLSNIYHGEGGNILIIQTFI